MIFLFACTNVRDFEDEHGVISQIIFMMKVLIMILMILMMTIMMTLVVLMMMMMVTKERGASTCSHASVAAQHKFCKNYIQCKICVVYNMYFQIYPLWRCNQKVEILCGMRLKYWERRGNIGSGEN